MTHRRRTALTVGIAAALLVSGGVQAKKVKGKRDPIYPITEPMQVPGELEILVLPVKVVTESLQDKARKREAEVAEQQIAEWLHGVSLEILKQKGFTATSLADSDPPDEVKNLTEISGQFVRGRLGPDASPDLLKTFAAAEEPRAVMFLYLEVELATKGYWDAWTGGMRVGMSNSDLRGSVLDCSSGDVLWRGELYIRTVPKVDDATFETAVTDMFDNLLRRED